ncbi:MAG TPA: glutamate--tRNA ligase family protein, partial [Planctomycetota bacterium]|nr:glutamate--tRNA ligase family protein [Planctomycetota bacterium]
IVLRIEDLDTPRVKPGALEAIEEDLRWLGLDWDGPVEVQSRRRDHYRAVFERLRPRLYPCGCTRADIAAAASAPHEGETEIRYPGACRDRAPAKTVAWRLRVEPGSLAFDDLLSGRHEVDVASEVGDFVVAKSPEAPAYQLAVVADDIDQGVNQVVRGADLIPSTARQLLLYRALGAPPPEYGHAPLVVGPDGKRLAKRHGESRIAALRSSGAAPEKIVATLARWSALPPLGRPAELIPHWDWVKLNRERIVYTAGT